MLHGEVAEPTAVWLPLARSSAMACAAGDRRACDEAGKRLGDGSETAAASACHPASSPTMPAGATSARLRTGSSQSSALGPT